MHYLFISDFYPEFDRNSADFRLSQLIAAVKKCAEVDFLAIGEKRQKTETGEQQTLYYHDSLTNSGIRVLRGGLRNVLKQHSYDVIVTEWYFCAAPFIDDIRLTNPGARLVTDSVDVVFNRLHTKARVSKLPEDEKRAESVRRQELDVYRRSDLVLTVTDSDAAILHQQDRGLETFTIPNIHPCHAPVSSTRDTGKTLIFIGSFSEANNDAVSFFCRDVFPLILQEEPGTRFRLVGNATAPEIQDVPAGNIEIPGYVASTLPYLKSSLISIAPLRFGGGMKGKVGEAMSLGVPVVATSIGAEGFGIESGREALIEDDPRKFAHAVIRLIRDESLRDDIRMLGWQFIKDNYSDVAVRERVRLLIERMDTIRPQRLPLASRISGNVRDFWQRHIAWRFN